MPPLSFCPNGWLWDQGSISSTWIWARTYFSVPHWLSYMLTPSLVVMMMTANYWRRNKSSLLFALAALFCPLSSTQHALKSAGCKEILQAGEISSLLMSVWEMSPFELMATCQYCHQFRPGEKLPADQRTGWCQPLVCCLQHNRSSPHKTAEMEQVPWHKAGKTLPRASVTTLSYTDSSWGKFTIFLVSLFHHFATLLNTVFLI